MSILRINTFLAKDDKAEELHAFLNAVVAPILSASKGCEGVRILRNLGKPAECVVMETWDSVESHQASAKTIPKEKIAAVMPLLAAPPSGAYFSG